MNLLISTGLPGLLKYDTRHLGRLFVPEMKGNIAGTIKAGMPMAADNGCFGGLVEKKVMALLNFVKGAPIQWFAVPDVVGDARATRKRWDEWAPIVRRFDVPLAYVLQDGSEDVEPPWGELDAVFIGGSDKFKESPCAHRAVEKAASLGLPRHMGRVNSEARITLAYNWGCTSIDGSGFGRHPDAKIPGAVALLARLHEDPPTLDVRQADLRGWA